MNVISVLKIVSSSKHDLASKISTDYSLFSTALQSCSLLRGVRGKASPCERGQDTCDGYQI